MEETMFDATEKATEMIKHTFKFRNQMPPIRIEVSGDTWGGPSLGMVPDEPHDDDMIFTDIEKL